MTENNKLYCKIYIDCDLIKDKLIQTIAELVCGNTNLWGIQATDCEIDVRENEYFDEKQRHKYPDGFLYYPYYLDIEPSEEVAPSFYKETVARLLEAFWAKNYQAIVACDFEEELPRKGGYKWK